MQSGVQDMCTETPEVDYIAIGAGASNSAGADISFRSGNIFNDDGCKSRLLMRSAKIRPNTSMGLPGANGTIMVIGRAG